MNPFVEAQFIYQGAMAMIGTERYCKKCGHRCHCYQPDCKDCANDVCTQCDCKNEKDIPSSFTQENV